MNMWRHYHMFLQAFLLLWTLTSGTNPNQQSFLDKFLTAQKRSFAFIDSIAQNQETRELNARRNYKTYDEFQKNDGPDDQHSENQILLEIIKNQTIRLTLDKFFQKLVNVSNETDINNYIINKGARDLTTDTNSVVDNDSKEKIFETVSGQNDTKAKKPIRDIKDNDALVKTSKDVQNQLVPAKTATAKNNFGFNGPPIVNEKDEDEFTPITFMHVTLEGMEKDKSSPMVLQFPIYVNLGPTYDKVKYFQNPGNPLDDALKGHYESALKYTKN